MGKDFTPGWYCEIFSRENLWQSKVFTSDKEDEKCPKLTTELYLRDPDNSLHPKPLQFIDKAASCNAQEFSCSRTIPPSLNKSTSDRVYLHLSKGLEIRLARCGGFVSNRMSVRRFVASVSKPAEARTCMYNSR